MEFYPREENIAVLCALHKLGAIGKRHVPLEAIQRLTRLDKKTIRKSLKQLGNLPIPLIGFHGGRRGDVYLTSDGALVANGLVEEGRCD